MPKPRTFRLEDQAYSYLKTYEKEHKCKSETDALNQLIRDFASLQTQKPTSDVPLGEPIDPEKQKAIHELHQEAITPLPPPQCNYVGEGKGYIDPKTGVQMVFCDNPKKYKEPKAVPLASCIACWRRKEWVREKKEREAEQASKPQEEEEPFKALKDMQYRDEKEARLLYHCNLKDKWIHFLELPCIKEWDKNHGQILCTQEQCATQILNKIYE